MKLQHVMISNVNTNIPSVFTLHIMAEVGEPDYTVEGEIGPPGECKEKEIKHLDMAQGDISLELLKILSKSEYCIYVFKDGDPLFLESIVFKKCVKFRYVNGFIETIKLFLEKHKGSVIQYMKYKVSYNGFGKITYKVNQKISLLDILCDMVTENIIVNKYLVDIFSREESINISEYFIVRSYNTTDHTLKYFNIIHANIVVALIMIDGSKQRFFREHVFGMTKKNYTT